MAEKKNRDGDRTVPRETTAEKKKHTSDFHHHITEKREEETKINFITTQRR